MASIVIGVGLVLVTIGGLVARYVPIPGHRTLYAVIASPFVILAAVVAILVFLWSRHFVMAGLATCLAVAVVVPQVPWYVSATPAPEGVTVRAMTANMLYGRADPRSLMAVASREADVLMLQELTPKAVQGLTDAGIDREFPHRAVEARPGAAGAAVYSRYPLSNVETIHDFEMPMVKADLLVPGAQDELTVLSMHFAAPWPQPIGGWQHDVAMFPNTLNDLASRSGDAPILIGGDFNSTIDMRPFRDLLTNGYRDASEQAGSGRTLTYPSNNRIPPFMGIDHFLTRNATAVATRTVAIEGTDHRALLATIVVPRSDDTSSTNPGIDAPSTGS